MASLNKKLGIKKALKIKVRKRKMVVVEIEYDETDPMHVRAAEAFADAALYGDMTALKALPPNCLAENPFTVRRLHRNKGAR